VQSAAAGFVPLLGRRGGFTPSQPSPIKGEDFTQGAELVPQVIRDAVENDVNTLARKRGEKGWGQKKDAGVRYRRRKYSS
jgi:hypothetical protein